MYKQVPFIVVIEIAALCILLTAFALVCIVISVRYRYQRDEKFKASLAEIIDNLILELIVVEEIPKDIEYLGDSVADLRALVGNVKWKRQILIEKLIELQWNIAGANRKIMVDIYLSLELFKDSLKKISSTVWYNRMQGLQEVTYMDYAITDLDILQFTLNSNADVRSAARCAYLKFSKNDSFRFLDEVQDTLTVVELIEFFRIINNSNGFGNSNFANWIRYSRNKTVVSCCIRFAAYCNEVNAIESIRGVLGGNDHGLRAEAINALGRLKAVSVEDELIAIYGSQPIECQKEILFALGMIGSATGIEFVKSEFLNAKLFEVKRIAGRVLARFLTKPKFEKFQSSIGIEHQHILKII